MISLIQTIIETTLILTISSVGVWMTSRLLKFDDLSVEAGFCWGGAITARLLCEGFNPLISTFFAIIGGIILGLVISALYTKAHLTPIMTGIITATALFSCNLWVGGANRTLAWSPTLFDWLPTLSPQYKMLIPLSIISVGIILIIRWLLTTEIGLLLRAVGENPLLITHVGKSATLYQTLHLIIAHGLIALAGSLFVQYTGFFSLWSSVGILVATLSATMLSHIIAPGFGFQIMAGALIYQSIITLSLSANVPPEWNKLISALILLVLMITQKNGKK